MDDETRVQYEGFRPGMYIRVEITSAPCEFVTNFDPHYPIILGGLGSSESSIGFLQVGTHIHMNIRAKLVIQMNLIEIMMQSMHRDLIIC